VSTSVTAPVQLREMDAALKTLRYAAAGITERTEMPSQQAAALLASLASAEAVNADLREMLASIRVFAQDCIENGHDRGQLGNLYAIRDLCDRLASRGGPQL
jgi:hypothetical protein